jgi:hypothetical protein
MVFLQLEQIFMLLELNEYATTRIMVMNLMPMVWLILQYSVDAMCTIKISFCQGLLNRYALMLLILKKIILLIKKIILHAAYYRTSDSLVQVYLVTGMPCTVL